MPVRFFLAIIVVVLSLGYYSSSARAQSATTFSFTIFLHGIGKGGDAVNPNAVSATTPVRQQRSLKIELYDANSALKASQTLPVTFNSTSGAFTGSGSVSVPNGPYIMKLHVVNFLRKNVPGIITITQGSPVTIQPVRLTTGDTNDDNKLSILDYNMILDCFSDLAAPRNCADANKKLATDLTDDGNVNQFDYNLLLRELSVQTGDGGDPVPTTSLIPLPNTSPTPVTNNFTMVDPLHWTDASINRFVKNQVTQGHRKVAAGGAWWGPVDKFFENQVWLVNRTIITGRRFPHNHQLQQQVACWLPGKTNESLSGQKPVNNLVLLNGGKGDESITIGSPNLSEAGYNNVTPGQFITVSAPLRYAVDVGQDPATAAGYALFTSCNTKEGVTGQFGDGMPKAGDLMNAQIRQVTWVDRDASANGDGYWNFQDIPTRKTPLYVRAWYSQLEYIIGGITSAKAGNFTETEAYNLVGGTVKGNLTVWGIAQRINLGGNDASSHLHHAELRIDQNDKDYTVSRVLRTPTEVGLGLKGIWEMTLDTTTISDGWHILSWHFHVIDKQNPAPRAGKQLAGELKIPICVANTANSGCPANSF